MRYASRPGISPALATLIAAGDIRKDDVIVDIGCGTGTECLLLAKWGFRHVVGLDTDAGAVRIARGRATRMRLGRRVSFHVGGPEDLPPRLAVRGCDVVLHTLVGNNLRSGYHAHFRAIARALKRDGLFVASIRTFQYEENRRPGAVPPIAGMARYFELSPSVSSHLAESPKYFPGHAPVATWIGGPKARASRAPRRRGRR